MDLYGRDIVDSAIDIINGYLFCGQASTKVKMEVTVAGNGNKKISMKERKRMIAERYVRKAAPKIEAHIENIKSGNRSTFSDYEAVIGPVPTE